jgi:hypothetical protein
MAAKLKLMQASSVKQAQSQKERLADVTSMSNQPAQRTGRTADEMNTKTTINRMPNEAKTSIADREKKQEKILLSPINTSKSFDAFNQDSEYGKFKILPLKLRAS